MRWTDARGPPWGSATARELFTRGQVAPCLALDPAINAACAEAWRANRTWFEQLIDTPIPGLLVAAVLATATLLLFQIGRSTST